MLANATRICEAKFGTSLSLYDGDEFRPSRCMACRRACRSPTARSNHPSEPGRASLGRVAVTKQVGPHCRYQAEKAYIERRSPFVASPTSAVARTLLIVPMLKEDELVGAIGIYRQEVRAVHRQADRAGQELRRAGGHRHREHAPAQRAARSRCSSRPPPPTCSRSSAARPSTCRPCSTRSSNRRHGCARRIWLSIGRPRDYGLSARGDLRPSARVTTNG